MQRFVSFYTLLLTFTERTTSAIQFLNLVHEVLLKRGKAR